MQFSREKHTSSTSPKIGRSYNNKRQHCWLQRLLPITGLMATIWFFVRVLPKPSRALYPCQRVAFPLASSFIAYICGIFVSALAFRKAKQRFYQSRYLIAGLCLLVGVSAVCLMEGINSDRAEAEYLPTDPPNSPIGVAKGIHPGRVVWTHDSNATFWDPAWDDRTDIFYWDDDHTNQAVIEKMFSDSLQWLTGQFSDEAAWNALFIHFNQTKGKGDIGYTIGEKIVIKPNHVEQRSHTDQNNRADLSPQIVLALLKQLVNKAGIPQQDITLSDASRFIADKTFNRCQALFPNVIYAETNFYNLDNDPGTEGREMVQTSSEPMIHYSGNDIDGQPIPSDFLPTHLIETDYIINLAIMKGHSSAGATLCAKNWYGCFCATPGSAHHDLLPRNTPQPDQYRLMVDLMGHEHLGAKTMLYMLDGLWGFPFHGTSSRPTKWQNAPFNNNYPSSILISQDPVAIDSVGLDFLRAEFADNMGGSGLEGAIDDYLHEAALADSPASGTFYDPENDGTSLSSLGVHEHWNNSTDKQYSCNLGTGNGIELVTVSDTGEPVKDFNGDGYTDISWRHATTGQNVIWLMDGTSLDSYAWLDTVDDTNWKIVDVDDFDTDGDPDILWRHATTGQIVIWVMHGTLIDSYTWLPTVPDTDWEIVEIADFNCDNYSDILWRHASSGQNVIWIMNGTSVDSYAWLDSVADTCWKIAGVAAFNNDCFTDILWRNTCTGQNVIWVMDETSLNSYAWLNTVGDTNWEIVDIADFDTDNDPDILWRHNTSGQNVIWVMDGTTLDSYAWLDTVADTNWEIADVGNFDTDTDTDILWRHATTGQNVIWVMDGTSLDSYAWLDTVADTDWEIQ